jgi:hypothetical protein
LTWAGNREEKISIARRPDRSKNKIAIRAAGARSADFVKLFLLLFVNFLNGV